MNYDDRLQWMFEEFMKEHCRADRAEAEIKILKAPLKFAIALAAKKRQHRNGSKRKNLNISYEISDRKAHKNRT